MAIAGDARSVPAISAARTRRAYFAITVMLFGIVAWGFWAVPLVAGGLIVVAFFKVPLFAAVPIARDIGRALLGPFL